VPISLALLQATMSAASRTTSVTGATSGDRNYPASAPAGRTAGRPRQGFEPDSGKQPVSTCTRSTRRRRAGRWSGEPTWNRTLHGLDRLGQSRGLGLDFNGTFFSHPERRTAYLTSRDEGVRRFWVDHGIACRKIGAASARRSARPA